MGFELKQLREVVQKYSSHDADTHGVYPRLVWKWGSRSPTARLDDAGDPQSFVSYQRFGWKLLHHVTQNKSISALRQLERDHARSVGYFEPMTMILDHLAFSPKLSARAVAALGGPPNAFSHDLTVRALLNT